MNYEFHLQSFVDDYTAAVESFERGNYKAFFRNYRPSIESLCIGILTALHKDEVEEILNGTKGFSKDGKAFIVAPCSAKPRTGRFLIDLAKMAMLKQLSDEKANKLVISHMQLAYFTLIRDYHFASCACHSFTDPKSFLSFDKNMVSECLVGTNNFIDLVTRFLPEDGKKILLMCPQLTVDVSITYPDPSKEIIRPISYTAASAKVIRETESQDDYIDRQQADVPKMEQSGEPEEEPVPDRLPFNYVPDVPYPEIEPEYDVKNTESDIQLNVVSVNENQEDMIKRNLQNYRPYISRPKPAYRPRPVIDDQDDDAEEENHGTYYEHNNYMFKKYRCQYKGEIQTEGGKRYQVPVEENPELYDECEVYFDIKAIPNFDPSRPDFLIAINTEIID